MRGITVVTVLVCLVWSGVLALRPDAGYSQTVSNLGLMIVALLAGCGAMWRSTREVASAGKT